MHMEVGTVMMKHRKEMRPPQRRRGPVYSALHGRGRARSPGNQITCFSTPLILAGKLHWNPFQELSLQ